MRAALRLFFVLAIFGSVAWSAEWVPGQTYFQGDTVELDWSAWTLVAPSNAGWEQLPPSSASLSAVWQPVLIDTCTRAWKSGEAYVQNQVVLDSGRLWRLTLPSNAGWESWHPQSAFLWAVWEDVGAWESSGRCLSPSDHDSNGVPDVVGAIMETNGDASLFGHPDRWFVDTANRTVVYDFSSVPGYEKSDSVQFVLPPSPEPHPVPYQEPVPFFFVVTTSQRNLPKVPDGYHFIGPEIRISFPSGTESQTGLVPIPLPDRVRNASLSDVLAFVHEGDTAWHSVPVLYFGDRKAIVRVYGTTAIRFAVKEKDVVWSPGYEQTNFMVWALYSWNTALLEDTTFDLRQEMSNSPTFFSEGEIKPMLRIESPIGTPGWYDKMAVYQTSVIRPALELAARTGINTIDLHFYNDSLRHNVNGCFSDNAGHCKSYANYLAFRQWSEEIERHNLESPGRMLRIRARMHPWPFNIAEFYESFDGNAYSMGSSARCDVPSQADLSAFRGWRSHLAQSLGRYNADNDAYLNLRDPLVVRMMNAYFCISLEELQETVGDEIEIDAITLALDNGGETGLSSLAMDPTADVITRPITDDTLRTPILGFQAETDTGDVFPAEWWIDYIGHIDEILSFIGSRRETLREVYVAFATAVRSAVPLFPAKRQLASAIFYQDWFGDALYRGALNGYDLVRGTGISLYHHGMFAVPSSMQRATQAFPIGIRNAVNILAGHDSVIDFDTEMSWAHWDKAIIIGGRDTSLHNNMWWKRIFLTAENARNFRNQADAAIRADAAGYVLCNWSIQDVLNRSNGKADAFDSTRDEWRRILGDTDDEHIYGEGGIVSVGPDAIRRRIAVYISDPVALLTQLSGTWMDMLYGTGNWYDAPGGLFGKLLRFCGEHCEIAVVNDAMILDTEGEILNFYDEIWIAYPNGNLHPEVRDTCIARTERSTAFEYLRFHYRSTPPPPFPIELYPPLF